MKSKTRKQLEERIIFLNKKYREGNPVVPDFEYDELLREYSEKYPDSPLLERSILEKPKESRKRGLPVRMGSLNKLHSLQEVISWVSYFDIGHYITLTPKFDGISLLVDERTNKSFTRGDGFVGQLCDEHYKKLNNKVEKEYSCYSYGEAIMSKKNFEKFSDKYANARNLVAGLFNRDEPSDLLNNVDYLRYGIVDEERELGKVTQLTLCNEMNSVPVPFKFLKIKEFLDQDLKEYLNDLFELWSEYYAIDGIVIDINSSIVRKQFGRENNGNPAYARAIKFPEWSEGATVKVEKVSFNVSKQGKMKPVINIEPTVIAGAKISNVTGYNAKYIFDNNIAEGSIIEVVRSGDVIPKHIKTISYITENVRELSDKITECPSCGEVTKWDETFTELVCVNDNCKEKQVSKLCHFFLVLGVEDFGEPSIRKFYDNGFTDLSSILSVTKEQMNLIEGWGEISSNKLINQFENLKKNGVPFAKLIHALDLMDGKIGEKVCQKIIDNIANPEDTIYKIVNGEFNDKSFENKLTEIDGVAESTAKAFYSGIKRFKEYISLPVKISYFDTPKKKIEGGKYLGWKICFTGVRPKDDQKHFIETNGGVIVSGISKKTTHLVVKDLNSNSSKMKKAKELNISIITLEQLMGEL